MVGQVGNVIWWQTDSIEHHITAWITSVGSRSLHIGQWVNAYNSTDVFIQTHSYIVGNFALKAWKQTIEDRKTLEKNIYN